jgi:nucleoprotein TPR
LQWIASVVLLIGFWSTAASQSALQSQITALEATRASSTGEVDKLRKRVDDVEREKRDLVGIISRLKQENESREGMENVIHPFLVLMLLYYIEEIQTLRTNLKEARQDYQSLETQLREVRSAETSTKVMRSNTDT